MAIDRSICPPRTKIMPAGSEYIGKGMCSFKRTDMSDVRVLLERWLEVKCDEVFQNGGAIGNVVHGSIIQEKCCRSM